MHKGFEQILLSVKCIIADGNGMEQVGALTTVRFPEPAASLRDHQGSEPLQFIYYD